MRRILPALFILFIAAWAPDSFQRRYYTETLDLTEAAPTASDAGMNLSSAISFTTIVRPATGGATLTDGTVDIYYRDATYDWYLGDPATFMDIGICAGRTSCSKTFPLVHQHGRVFAAPNGVTVSSGTEVTIEMFANVSGRSYSAP